MNWKRMPLIAPNENNVPICAPVYPKEVRNGVIIPLGRDENRKKRRKTMRKERKGRRS